MAIIIIISISGYNRTAECFIPIFLKAFRTTTVVLINRIMFFIHKFFYVNTMTFTKLN